MARITVRIPDQTKRQMDRHEEINWSELIRKSIHERLVQLDGPTSRKIQLLVEDYRDDQSKLWILHMFAEGIRKQDVYETAEHLFDEQMDDVVNDVEADLDEFGLTRMYETIGGDARIGDTIRSMIASEGHSSIEAHVVESINEAPLEVRKGVHLLTYYMNDWIESESFSFSPEGFERTWNSYVDAEIDVNNLVETGLVYRNFYSSNAYSHWSHRVPNYGMELLERYQNGDSDLDVYGTAPTWSTMRDLFDDPASVAFLRWMGGQTKFVQEYNEREEIETELEESDSELDWPAFQSVRDELIRKEVLVIDYSPHRSSTGNRSSRPARWKYKLTQPALDHLPAMLLETV